MGHVNIWRKNGTDEHRNFHLPTPPPVLAGRQLNKRKSQDKTQCSPNIQCSVLNHHYSRHGIQHIHYIWTSANETVRGAREGPSYTKTCVEYCDLGGPALRVLLFPPKVSADFYFPKESMRAQVAF